MADVKLAISLLCNILNLLCKDDILRPECFRSARCDESDNNIISAFWNILMIFSNNSDTTNIVRTVKLYFAGIKYKSPEFYNLANDMSNGSKELLLALSWLIGEKNIIELLLWQEISKSKISHEFFLNSDINFKNLEFTAELNIIRDYKKAVLLLAGKINAHIKKAFECNEKLSELIIKKHKEIRDLNKISYFSVADINYLKNPKSMEPYINEIKYVSNLLFNYDKWKLKETYYWDWMVTVMNEKFESKTQCIDMKNTESFFEHFRYKVKQILVQNTRESEETQENILARCIHFVDPLENAERRLMNDKHIDDLENEEMKFTKTILHYLHDFVFTES